MTDKLKIALVGCGAAGESHLKSMLSCHEFQTKAIADIRLEAARHFSEKYGIDNFYTSYKDLFATESLDAIAVITSGDTHYPIVRDALMEGIHVICEKPLALSSRESLELAELAKNKKRILAVTFTYRFVEDTRYIKKIISNGTIGKIAEMRFIFLSGKFQGYSSNSEEKRRFDQIFTKVKGTVFDCGIHAIDLFQWYAEAEVTRIDARGTCHLGYPYPDSITAIMEFENGVKGIYDYGKLPYFESDIPGQTYLKIIITGEKGTIIWSLGTASRNESVLNVHSPSGFLEKKFPIYHDKGRPLQYKQFAESIHAGRLEGYFPSAENVAKATEIADKTVKKSMENVMISPFKNLDSG